MALSVYLRTGGPDQAGARAAINAIFDRMAATQGTAAMGTFGYWCYSDGGCADSSTTQFVVAGLAAARGVFSDPAYADPVRLALLNTLADNSRQAYEANGTSDGFPNERGHGYNVGHQNSLQQTASGLWIQLAGGADLNAIGVQQYLRWIHHRYAYSTINAAGGGWGFLSYSYYMWSKSKALAFIDQSGVSPLPGNIGTDALGTLPPGSAPAFAAREMHRDPATDLRVNIHGGGSPGHYSAEAPRWYYDGAYSFIAHQNASGFFENAPANGSWDVYAN